MECRLNNVAKITDFIIVVNLDLGMATGLFQVTQLSQKKNGRSMQAKCICVPSRAGNLSLSYPELEPSKAVILLA